MKGHKGGRRSLEVGVRQSLSSGGSLVLVCKAFGRDFAGGSVVRSDSAFPTQGAQIQSLVRELDPTSHS